MQALRTRLTVVGAVVVAGLTSMTACGDGSVGTNGTGSPLKSGLSVGTVSGLGSLIVDGTRHDDSTARIEINRQGTEAEPGDARIGHRVSLAFTTDSAGAQVLQRVELLPSVVGRVNERTADTLGMLGQTVTVNGDPARGPVTTFGPPLTSLASVGLGDVLEVHALAQRTGSGTSEVRLVATRIERRSAASAVRVSGTVAELATSGGTRRFRLGALTVEVPSTAEVSPAGTELRVGWPVTVHAAESGFDPATLTLVASRVQTALDGSGGSTEGVLRRAGLVSGWTGATFSLDSVSVAVDADTVVQPAGQPLANGAYVHVTASPTTAGPWRATRIERLSMTTVGAELRGTLVDWAASASTFSVRDTPVTLTPTTRLDLSGCQAAALAEGLFVQVMGASTAQGLTASSITCEPEPRGSTKARLARRGVVMAVDIGARQLTLRQKAGDPLLTVAWTQQTALREPLTFATLAALAGSSREIEVEGSLSLDGRQLAARKIRLR